MEGSEKSHCKSVGFKIICLCSANICSAIAPGQNRVASPGPYLIISANAFIGRVLLDRTCPGSRKVRHRGGDRAR
jgi:hypothetical protein